MSTPQKDPELVVIELIDTCVDELNKLKVYFQNKLDSKKAPVPPPLPPPLPEQIRPEEKKINIKTIKGSSVSNGRLLLQQVSIIKNRPPTLFDIEIAASVKKRRAEMDGNGLSESYWNSFYRPPLKRQKTSFEIELENRHKEFMTRKEEKNKMG